MPQFDKWEGQSCHGLQLHVTDPRAYKSYYTTLTIIQVVMGLWPAQFSWRPPPYEYEFEHLPIDIISGNEAIRKGLEQGMDLNKMEVCWTQELEGFIKRRQQHIFY